MAASVVASSDVLGDLERIGEVVETGTTGFWAESDRLHAVPSLGELVWVRGVGAGRLFGVVTYGETSGLEPGRKAIRRGNDSYADAAIYSRHPELEFVLRTMFHVAAIGSDGGGRIRHVLPPLPAPLHYSVHPSGPDDVRAFTRDPDYFPELLAYTGETPAEQVVAAHLTWVDQHLDDGHAWLAAATRRLARLMKRDYDRLSIILRAVDPG